MIIKDMFRQSGTSPFHLVTAINKWEKDDHRVGIVYRVGRIEIDLSLRNELTDSSQLMDLWIAMTFMKIVHQ